MVPVGDGCRTETDVIENAGCSPPASRCVDCKVNSACQISALGCTRKPHARSCLVRVRRWPTLRHPHMQTVGRRRIWQILPRRGHTAERVEPPAWPCRLHKGVRPCRSSPRLRQRPFWRCVKISDHAQKDPRLRDTAVGRARPTSGADAPEPSPGWDRGNTRTRTRTCPAGRKTPLRIQSRTAGPAAASRTCSARWTAKSTSRDIPCPCTRPSRRRKRPDAGVRDIPRRGNQKYPECGHSRVYTTKLVPANTASSLRSTIPRAIVKRLDLKAGSKLEWHVVDKDNETVVYVKPESAEHA